MTLDEKNIRGKKACVVSIYDNFTWPKMQKI